MATANRKRRWSEFEGYVGHLQAEGKEERNFRRDGRSGDPCERKVKYVEQQLQKKYEERNRIVQNGRSCGHGRKTEGKRRDMISDLLLELRKRRDEEDEAEWVSMKEIKALQGACMRTSTMAREQQHEGLLSSMDDQVWKELSDDWQRYLLEKEESPAL